MRGLKKNLVLTLSGAERRRLVERDATADLPLVTQAELLSVSRSSLYYQAAVASPEEVAVKHQIDRIYTEWPTYGSRRLAAQLYRDGYQVSRQRVQRYLREMGLEAIYPGPKTSQRNPEHQVYPYLLRNLTINRPDQVWGIDITYIPLRQGWMYLVAVLDWYSRYVVSWELSDSLEIGFVLRAVSVALAEAQPEILNSDQGSHFTSPQYTRLLQEAGVRISMDGKGRALDNIFTERFWRTVKYDEVYLHGYETPRESEVGLGRFLPRYNDERLHSSLGNLTPSEVYHGGARPAVIHLGKKPKKGQEATLEKDNFLS